MSIIQSVEAITIGSYRDICHKFSSETNLVNGLVLLNSEMVKCQRFNGNYRYNRGEGIKNNREICSFTDKGLDSMSDLIVQLFPSAGVTFNAQGTGSIQDRLFKSKKINKVDLKTQHYNQETGSIMFQLLEFKEKIDMVDIIAGMFKIDIDVRKNGELFEILKEIDKQKVTKRDRKGEREEKKKLREELKKGFLEKCFSFQSESPDSHDALFNLVNTIANAIQLEREEGKEDQQKEEKPYPPFYTNYLISAYAWSVLENNQLDELAKKLGYTEDRTPYEDEFTKRIYEDVTKNPSVVPFYAEDEILKHNSTRYKQTEFADCIETTLRHFCATVFCKAIKDKNGEYTGDIVLDLDRIPKEATALREFFAPRGMPRDIRELAKDGSTETREAWSKVVSGLPFVNYYKTHCELVGDWSNIMKAFCCLMEKYTEANGSKEVAECIKNINSAAKAGTLSFTKETLLKTLNILLKVRTDIKMIAKESDDSSKELLNKKSDIFGGILIRPVLDQNKYDEKAIKINELNFIIEYGGHGYLDNIPSLPKKIDSSPDVTINVAKPWIERLYDNKELAISAYPLLDFCMKLGKGRIDKDALVEMFSSPTPHIDAIARYLNSQYYFDSSTFYKIMFDEGISNKNGSLEQKRRHFIESVFMFSDKMKTTQEALTCLNYRIAPENLSELFLKNGEKGTEKLSVNITNKTSIEKLIALRLITKHAEEIDPFIENFIEKTYNADTFNVDENQVKDIWKSFINDVLNAFSILKDQKSTPRFKISMFDVFIKCLGGILNSPVKNSIRIENDRIVDSLSLMDCDENNPTFNQFVKFAAGSMWLTKEEILLQIRRQ